MVGTQSEDLGPLVHAKRVIDHELQTYAPRGQALHQRKQPETSEDVEVPATACKNAVECRVLPDCGGTAHDETLGDGMTFGAKQPRHHQQQPARVGRCGERGAEHFQSTQKRATTVLGHGASVGLGKDSTTTTSRGAPCLSPTFFAVRQGPNLS